MAYHTAKSAGQIVGLLATLSATAAQTLPYTPTRILVAPNSSYAYVFDGESGQPAFTRLDIKGTIARSNNGNDTLSQTLPFGSPYTPILDTASGNISVIAGNCSRSGSTVQVWRWINDDRISGSHGVWIDHSASAQGLKASGYLASGVAFSENAGGDGSNVSLYTFGGMCPYSNITDTTWTCDAQYSNSMLALSANDSDAQSGGYDMSAVASKGSPIAEAGFSMTPLSPTYSAPVTGLAQKQQQSFVLIGGHTHAAFINMSQVAVFSLPQASWAFAPVSQGQTDVEPRSGHSAVLSEDGSSVVVIGGWVGDISTPATPQLAVLGLGSAYGGAGQMSWKVPQQSGPGLASGTGIYGHGAAMLPGNIIMVAGGYSISASSSKRIKRATHSANSQLYFYNISSSTWLQSYEPPTNFTAEAGHAIGPLSRKSQQAGLGIGLGIGAAILIALLVFYFWSLRRLKRTRETQGRALLSRSSDGFGEQPIGLAHTHNGGIDGRGGDTAGVGRFWNVWDPATGTYPTRAPQMQQTAGAAGSTGLFVDLPSPTRGLRKGVAGRNYQYLAAPKYDDNRLSHGSGRIHPIAEHEEEDEHALSAIYTPRDGLTDAERKLMEVERVLSLPDPFADAEPNPLGSHPVTPEIDYSGTVRRVPTGASRMTAYKRRLSDTQPLDVPNWTVEPTTAQPLLELDTGRISPQHSDDRTASTLSDRSHMTASSVTRTMSTRTGAIMAAVARAASNSSPEHSSSGEDCPNTMSTEGGRKSPFYFQAGGKALTASAGAGAPPHSAGTDTGSFVTAKTNFAQLQSEGEALLGGRPSIDQDDPYQRALAAHSSTREKKPFKMYDDYGAAPPIPPRRRQGWMGSLRRALNVVTLSERSFSLTGNGEHYADDARASSSSPSKDRNGRYEVIGAGPPRRAVSDGSMLLRQKRGQKDWEDGNPWPRYRDDPDPGDWGEPGLSAQAEEEEWDVEGAASRRVVQFMFTVPKANLRVVNADMDRASLRSASDGALSRTNSVKYVRREASSRTLRARSEGDRLLMPLAPAQEECEVVAGGDGDEDILIGFDGKSKAS
ncbi:hypothetical protein BAUCODRAFT_33160 [Baudoinia panamericana UAMH 10762]|uniref:Galactose oxidase-like Early set domain-containing protein n=1 Tax=Baudoinia panamericana (strain UAMH 10762) TaxID=717646 RepID=M2ML91_BAUPA|nr:uncharacterized protein BAUCODRAFT_33160 [Baudoinia panamericana UAMH 10762]EMC97441.1 hypothetical protein BAUCODRAFT_33160 [Baudoinia panamericana UAMH 10762]